MNGGEADPLGLQYCTLVSDSLQGAASFSLPLDFPDLDRAQPIFQYDFKFEHNIIDQQEMSAKEDEEAERARKERARMREQLEAEREERRKKEEQARREAEKQRIEQERLRQEQEALDRAHKAEQERIAEERRQRKAAEMERSRALQKEMHQKEQMRQMSNFCPGINPEQAKFLLESFNGNLPQAVEHYHKSSGLK